MAGVAGGWTTFGPILAIVLAPLIGYFAARRTSSGKIATSDATTLWREASGLRDSYKADSEQLRELVTTLRDSMENMRAGYEREAVALRLEISGLRGECRVLTEETAGLRAILVKEKPES